jgi:hypothetical protein
MIHINQLRGATPGHGGPGNTHSSRSGYYELNQIMAIARSHLPSNEWLKLRLTANMNIGEINRRPKSNKLSLSHVH